MAETSMKRQREESIEIEEETKRQKSINHLLSLLEQEEEEPNQDLSPLITILQQELSSSQYSNSISTTPTNVTDLEIENLNTVTTSVEDDHSSSSSSSSSSNFLKEDEEDDKERVIRHLLEASDDELGIPNREIVSGGEEDGFVNSGNGFNGVDDFSVCDELWEIEDANANYYTLLQSELFM